MDISHLDKFSQLIARQSLAAPKKPSCNWKQLELEFQTEKEIFLKYEKFLKALNNYDLTKRGE